MIRPHAVAKPDLVSIDWVPPRKLSVGKLCRRYTPSTLEVPTQAVGPLPRRLGLYWAGRLLGASQELEDGVGPVGPGLAWPSPRPDVRQFSEVC